MKPSKIVILILFLAVAGYFVYKLQNYVDKIAKVSPSPSVAEVDLTPKLETDDFGNYASKIGLEIEKFNECFENKKYQHIVMGDLAYGVELGVTSTPGVFINEKFIDGLGDYDQYRNAIENSLLNPQKSPVDLMDSATLGNKDAKVVVVEFSDFECPYCRQFFAKIEQRLVKEYVDTGKALFVYKHYPLNASHPRAQKAAEASECAKEQGKFWEMHDLLFGKRL